MSEVEVATEPRTDVLRCPLHEVDPMDPALNQAPHAFFRRLRDEAPVFRDARLGQVHVSRYEDIVAVSLQPLLFSNVYGGVNAVDRGLEMLPEELALGVDGSSGAPALLGADPPLHTRQKRLAIKGFSYKRVEQMGTYIERIVEDLIDGFIDKGRCEFKTTFADVLPAILIVDALGVDRALLPQWQVWLKSAEKRFAIERLTREERIQTAVHARELNDYLRAEFEDRRANPREDLITDLVHATIAGDGADRHLSEDELASIFNQIFFAGQETSAHTMTAGLYYLISNPDQMARLRADPELTGNFVEETLRFLTPVNNIYRRVTADTELGGVALKAGDMVVLKYGSANHDERRFADPERFDITRANAKEHLAFGSGVHHCLGAELARKEITIAFRILLRRLKNIRLAQDAGPIRYTPNHILRGVAELQIEFESA